MYNMDDRQGEIEVFPSHELFHSLKASRSPTGPQLMPPPRWHAEMAISDFASAVLLRSDKKRKLVDALCPNSDSSDAGDPRMTTLISYAQKVEAKVYQRVTSEGEYYRAMAAKIDTAPQELQNKRKRIEELCQSRTPNQTTSPNEQLPHVGMGAGSADYGNRERDVSAALRKLTIMSKYASADEQQTWISRLVKRNPAVLTEFIGWMGSRQSQVGSDSGKLKAADNADGSDARKHLPEKEQNKNKGTDTGRTFDNPAKTYFDSTRTNYSDCRQEQLTGTNFHAAIPMTRNQPVHQIGQPATASVHLGTIMAASGNSERGTGGAVSELVGALQCDNAELQRKWLFKLLTENPGIVTELGKWMTNKQGTNSEKVLQVEAMCRDSAGISGTHFDSTTAGVTGTNTRQNGVSSPVSNTVEIGS